MTASPQPPAEAARPERAEAALQRTTTGLWWLAGLWAAVLVGAWLWTTGLRVAYPYQLNHTEGHLLHCALQVAAGGPLYSNDPSFPYVPNCYGPIYPGLWGLALSAEEPLLWPGRLLAAAGALVVVGVLMAAVWGLTRSPLAALLAAGLFVSTRPAYLWAGLARVDYPALAFCMAGLLLLVARPRLGWLATLLFVAGFYTKQTMVAAPLAAYLYLWLAGRRQAAVGQALLFAGVAAVVLGLLWINSGAAAPQQLWWGTQNPWSLERWVSLTLPVVTLSQPVIALGAAVALLALVRRELAPWALYALFAAAVSTLAAREGADLNHFLELVAVLCVLAGVGLAAGRGLLASRHPALVLLALLVLVQFSVVWWRTQPEDPGRRLAGDRELVRVIRETPGPVLSEHLTAALQAGREVWLEPSVWAPTARAGNLDETPLLERLRRQEFPLIVLTRDPARQLQRGVDERWTEAALRAMVRHYRLDRVLAGRFHLLVPREPALEPPPGTYPHTRRDQDDS